MPVKREVQLTTTFCLRYSCQTFMRAEDIAFVIGFIWLGILSFLYWKEKGYLRRLFPQSENGDIKLKFKELIVLVEEFNKKGQILEERLLKVKKEGLSHLKNVTVTRYNPYNDTGGDQSFSAVFMDANLNGVLLTSLHSRSGTRIYAKVISEGKTDLELSKEEKEILKTTIEKTDNRR